MIHSVRPPRGLLVQPGQIEHHVADLTATASATVTLLALQERLAAAGQWLPMDGDPDLPLGRLVETNSTGPLRLGFGAWRDLLLGVQFTTRAGKLITAGGRTMKNVAGYDLTKFMVGQRGLFGRIETITVRTYRQPTAGLLARFEGPPARVIGELLPTTGRPQWAMLTGEGLFCGYLGDEGAIEFYEKDVAARAAIELRRWTVEADIAFRTERWLPSERAGVHYRVSVPPAKVEEFVRQARLVGTCPSPLPSPRARREGATHWAADAAFGVVVGSCEPEHRDPIRGAARACGGMAIFDDPEEIVACFGASGAERELLSRLQSAFDEQP